MSGGLLKKIEIWICEDCNTIYANYDVDYCKDCKTGLKLKEVILADELFGAIKRFKEIVKSYDKEMNPEKESDCLIMSYEDIIKEIKKIMGGVEENK